MYSKLDQIIMQAITSKIDTLIMQAITDGRHIQSSLGKSIILKKFCDYSGRDRYNVINSRMQALKKQGKIAFKKAQSPKDKGGWYVI